VALSKGGSIPISMAVRISLAGTHEGEETGRGRRVRRSRESPYCSL
jgi:hypothetical protein